MIATHTHTLSWNYVLSHTGNRCSADDNRLCLKFYNCIAYFHSSFCIESWHCYYTMFRYGCCIHDLSAVSIDLMRIRVWEAFILCDGCFLFVYLLLFVAIYWWYSLICAFRFFFAFFSSFCIYAIKIAIFIRSNVETTGNIVWDLLFFSSFFIFFSACLKIFHHKLIIAVNENEYYLMNPFFVVHFCRSVTLNLS